MKKWLPWACILILLTVAFLFTLGLRIDGQVLRDKLLHKSDTNAETLRKMGIDPAQIGFQGKPWYTFKPEDNLFKRASGWNPIQKMSDETWEASRKIKNELVKKQYGIDMEEALKEQARDAAAKAEFRRQLTEPRPEETP